MTTAKVAVFYNHTDASEYLANVVLKARHTMRLKAPDKPGQYAQQIERAYFEHGVAEFALPMFWEIAMSKNSVKLSTELAVLVSHLPVKLIAPLSNTTLEEIVSKLRTRKNFAGSCEHWQSDAPAESCGMCVPCLHRYLILKKLGKPTEEIFLEDPINGHDGKIRLYQLLTTISNPKHVMTRMEITIATLIADCFIKDIFPLDVSDIMEKRFNKFLHAWSAE